MKTGVIILLIIVLFPLISFGSEYIIVGNDPDGNYYYGEVEIRQGQGSGYIQNEEGESKKIDIEMTDKGIYIGYDEDGYYYELEAE